MKKRSVQMVTVSARDLKTAFRKAHPEVKTAQELYPVWLQFWSRLVLTAKVEKITPPETNEQEPRFREMDEEDEVLRGSADEDKAVVDLLKNEEKL